MFLFVVASLVVAPRALDGVAALRWTRYYAAVPASTRAGDHAQKAGRWAARAVDRGAPLPPASTAARVALDLGRSLEASNPGAAAAVYGDVRRALDRARASRLRGLGLEALAAEARSLEDGARAKLRDQAQRR